MNEGRGVHRSAPIRAAATVSVPARAAVSVFDMNTFAPGRAGGGNLGIALSIYTKVVVRRRQPDEIRTRDQSETQALFDHCVSVWTSKIGETGPFDLRLLESPLQHIGLASSSAFQAAVYVGLNWLDGLPLSESELLALLHSSYKEVVAGRTVDGFTTGLSGYLNLYGGFAALDTDLRPLRHLHLPPWKYVVAVPRKWATGSFGDEEAKLLMSEGKRLDDRDREDKRRLINDTLLPALDRRDLRKFGQGVHAIQQLGNKRCEILLHGERMDRALVELWNSGIECVFLSALGPAIVLLSESPIDRVAPLLDELRLDVMYAGTVDSTGVVITGGPDADAPIS